MPKNSELIISQGPDFSKVETEDLLFVLSSNFTNIECYEKEVFNPYFNLMLKEYLIRELPQNEEVQKIMERLKSITK